MSLGSQLAAAAQAFLSDPVRLRRLGYGAAGAAVGALLLKKLVLDPSRARAAARARQKEEEIASDAVLKTLKGDWGSRKQKVRVDGVFFARLRRLLAIVLPGVRSKEFFLLAVHSGFLVARTLLSIYVSQLDGTIVKDIVDRNGAQFVKDLAKWLLIAVPAVYINSMLRYLESKVAIQFRTRLVQHVYNIYMSYGTSTSARRTLAHHLCVALPNRCADSPFVLSLSLPSQRTRPPVPHPPKVAIAITKCAIWTVV
jgi:hypothetical protein